eukprot:s853_g4.t5
MVLTVGEANERFLGLLEPMGFAALQTQLQHWRWGILGNPGLQWELAQSLLVKIPQATLRRDAVSSTAALNSCEKVIAFNAALGAMGNLGARAWSSALQLLGVLKIFHLRSDLASLGSCMAAGAEPGGWRSTLLLLQLIKYVGLGAPDLRSLKAVAGNTASLRRQATRGAPGGLDHINLGMRGGRRMWRLTRWKQLS